MGKFKTIVVRVSGNISGTLVTEIEPEKVNKALEDGYEIKAVHQIASSASAGSSGLYGAVILTYVLYKE